MTWPTHLAGGITGALLLAPLLGPDQIPLVLLGSLLGALLPDLDAPQSRLSNTRIAGMQPLRFPARLLNTTLGHRGALHSFVGMFLACGLVSLPLVVFGLAGLALGIGVGFLSHLLLDAITRSGLPLLWPSPKRLYLAPAWLRVSTGSRAEELVFALLAGTDLLLLFQLLTRATLSQ